MRRSRFPRQFLARQRKLLMPSLSYERGSRSRMDAIGFYVSNLPGLSQMGGKDRSLNSSQELLNHVLGAFRNDLPP